MGRSSWKPWGIAIILVAVLAALAILFANHFKQPQIVAPLPQPVISQTAYASIGKSVEGRTIGSYSYGTGSKKVVFVGGIHGGYEWNAVALAYMLVDYLKANPDAVPTGETITIIPDLNPDAVYKATGKEGRFAISDVSADPKLLSSARFNADDVDLNRNFDCKWQPKSTWQNKTVSAGTSAFSEPEAAAFRDFIAANNPAAVVFWHSAAGAVYASQCGHGILPATLDMMNAYAKAGGYPAVKEFTAYPTTGAADDWLSTQGIPAITVELSSHSAIEWDKNLTGIEALLHEISR